MAGLPSLPPGRRALLPLRLFGPVGYYAVMAAYPEVAIDAGARYNKRDKATHRYDIVDVRGPLALTVAISHAADTPGRPTWADVRVSTHGSWWHQHRVSLESAYGRTPFFEFYIDRFAHILRERTPDDCESVADLCLEADALVRGILGLTTRVSAGYPADAAHYDSYLGGDFGTVALPPYYQVRADRLGFHPGLSILDLIFNLGPEAPLLLAQAEVD